MIQSEYMAQQSKVEASNENEPKKENWFKVGFEHYIVQGGYVGAAALFVFGTIVTLSSSEPTKDLFIALNAPAVGLFLITLMYHVKLGKRWNF